MVLLSSKYFAKDLGAMGQFVGPVSVAMVVFGIGLSLGGPSGYAINITLFLSCIHVFTYPLKFSLVLYLSNIFLFKC